MMGHRLLYIFILMGMFSGAFSQNKYTLSGTITDAESGEDLAGALLSVQHTSYNTICNPYGFYSITIPEGDFNIEVQFVGYENQLLEVNLHSNQVIDFTMKPVSYELDNIEVRGKAADQNITTSEMAIKIGVSPDAVKKHLAKLKMKNLIIRVGPDKGGHWEIVK